jgi:hypothetical protein
MSDAIAAETAKAMKAFRTAAANVAKQIEQLAQGNGDTRDVYRAIDRLDARANRPEIRGNAAESEACYALACELRRSAATAAERGAAVRRDRREFQMDRLSAREERPRDAALVAYERELKLARIG